MTCEPDSERDEKEQAGIQFDRYGIKARIPPAEDEEAAPTTWRDTWAQIERVLMRLVVAVPRLPTVILEGGARLIVGVTKLPAAIAARVRGAHQKTDKRESISESRLVDGSQPNLSQAESIDDLKAALAVIHARGNPAEIREHGGRFVVVVLRPELMDKADELIARAKANSGSAELRRSTRRTRRGSGFKPADAIPMRQPAKRSFAQGS